MIENYLKIHRDSYQSAILITRGGWSKRSRAQFAVLRNSYDAILILAGSSVEEEEEGEGEVAVPLSLLAAIPLSLLVAVPLSLLVHWTCLLTLILCKYHFVFSFFLLLYQLYVCVVL